MECQIWDLSKQEIGLTLMWLAFLMDFMEILQSWSILAKLILRFKEWYFFDHEIEVNQKALYNAIKICKPGRTISDVGKAIEETVQGTGFHVDEHFIGHGIGRFLHQHPQVYHTGNLKLIFSQSKRRWSRSKTRLNFYYWTYLNNGQHPESVGNGQRQHDDSGSWNSKLSVGTHCAYYWNRLRSPHSEIRREDWVNLRFSRSLKFYQSESQLAINSLKSVKDKV